ncbi:hypothetical protein BDV96DRAFT_651848 [Lophiotrema nucula]|uniref:F-box domain-containing protein n=1 Tax=Lophiotrema nucula TaxID=690887 RepID=A0A6A5YQW9_9PLEO|nr:hypothetical protein BDV96DRAFT_651848 [Lophiotrema nucula]
MTPGRKKKPIIIDLSDSDSDVKEVVEPKPAEKRRVRNVKKRGRPPGVSTKKKATKLTLVTASGSQATGFPIPLGDWPHDVVITLFENCSQGILGRLNRTSKAIRELSLPILYRDVDLTLYENKIGFCYYSLHVCIAFETRQARFCSILLQQPYLALYVRKLSWTIYHTGIGVEAPRLFQTLALMENVKSIVVEDGFFGDWPYTGRLNLSSNLLPKLECLSVSSRVQWDFLWDIVALSKHDHLDTLLLDIWFFDIPDAVQRLSATKRQTIQQFLEEFALKRFPKLEVCRIDVW